MSGLEYRQPARRAKLWTSVKIGTALAFATIMPLAGCQRDYSEKDLVDQIVQVVRVEHKGNVAELSAEEIAELGRRYSDLIDNQEANLLSGDYVEKHNYAERAVKGELSFEIRERGLDKNYWVGQGNQLEEWSNHQDPKPECAKRTRHTKRMGAIEAIKNFGTTAEKIILIVVGISTILLVGMFVESVLNTPRIRLHRLIKKIKDFSINPKSQAEKILQTQSFEHIKKIVQELIEIRYFFFRNRKYKMTEITDRVFQGLIIDTLREMGRHINAEDERWIKFSRREMSIMLDNEDVPKGLPSLHQISTCRFMYIPKKIEEYPPENILQELLGGIRSYYYPPEYELGTMLGHRMPYCFEFVRPNIVMRFISPDDKKILESDLESNKKLDIAEPIAKRETERRRERELAKYYDTSPTTYNDWPPTGPGTTVP